MPHANMVLTCRVMVKGVADLTGFSGLADRMFGM